MRQPADDATGSNPRHGGSKTSVGSSRQSREHVVFSEPAWPTGAFHNKLACFAVQRLEMMVIAERHFNAGRGGDVETGFIVQKNDVRQLMSRTAGRRRRCFQAFRNARVRFQISVYDKFVYAFDARSREFRNVILAEKILIQIGWERQRQKHEAAQAQQTTDNAITHPYAKRINLPSHHQKRDGGYASQCDPAAQRGKCGQQEFRGIMVDDHQVYEIDRYPELIVLELRQQNERDDELERHEDGSDRTAKNSKPETVEESPCKQERRLRDRIDFGRGHDDQGGQLQSNDEGNRHQVAAGSGPGRHKAAEQHVHGGIHGALRIYPRGKRWLSKSCLRIAPACSTICATSRSPNSADAIRASPMTPMSASRLSSVVQGHVTAAS